MVQIYNQILSFFTKPKDGFTQLWQISSKTNSATFSSTGSHKGQIIFSLETYLIIFSKSSCGSESLMLIHKVQT